MAMYTPLPFVGQPLDQSQSQMRLVDLLYQAQLARIQKEQEARLQGANMFMNLGLQLPQIVNQVEQNRIRAMQAEADITRANAYEQYMRDQAEANRQQAILRRQEARFGAIPGGGQVSLEGLEERFGPYAEGFEVTPLQASVSERSVTPQESVSLASLMRPEMDARPFGTLPSRPMGVSVLPGMAMETPTEFGGFATKPKSKEQLAAEEATAKAEAAQASFDAMRSGMTPGQQRIFDVARAVSGMNLPGSLTEKLTGVEPASSRSISQMEADNAWQWLQDNPDKTIVDWKAMVADATRAPRVESDSTASNLRTAESFRRNYENESKEWRIIAPAYGRVVAAYEAAVKGEASNQPSPAADMSLVFAFMKMLDPNSVVRETEYATAENARGVPEWIRATYNKIIDGTRLTASQRADFVSQAYAQVQSAANMQRERRDRYERRLGQIPDISHDAFLGDEMYVTTPVPKPVGSAGYGARLK